MTKPTISTQELQRRIGHRAKSRKGFGWSRWSSATVYGTWGLFDDYWVRYHRRAKAASTEKDA
jgi:hypothetical protein